MKALMRISGLLMWLAALILATGCGPDYSGPSTGVNVDPNNDLNNEGNNDVNNTGNNDLNNDLNNDTPDAGGDVIDEPDVVDPPDEDVPDPVETELLVAPVSQEVVVGEVVSFRALEIAGDSDRDATFDATWSVEPPGVATQIAPGRFRTERAGDAVVTATLGDLEAQGNLIVEDIEETLESLVIEPGLVEIPAGFEAQIQAVGVFDNGTSRNLSAEAAWEIAEGQDVAELVFGDEGQITVRGLAEGNAVVAATFLDQSTTATVIVTPVPLEAIEIIPSQVTVPAGDRIRLTALGRFANGRLLDITQEVTWETGDPTVATLSNDPGQEGTLLGETTGTTTVTARSGQINGQAQVRVTNAEVAQLTIDPPVVELPSGAIGVIRASAVISGNEAIDVTNEAQWASDDESIVTVEVIGNTARLQMLRPGTTTVTADYGQRQATCQVTVTEATLVTLGIAPQDLSLPAGTQNFLTLVGTYSDDSRAFLNNNALWSTSNPEVLLVDNGQFSGLITGRTPGRVTVTATLEGQQASATVTVTDAEVVGLQITPPTATTPAGDQVSLNAFAVYSDNNLRGVTDQATWVSLDPELVSVSNAPGERGQVTGVSAGDAQVQATFEDFSDTATVTVTDAVVEQLFITPGQVGLPAGRSRELNLLAVYSNGSTLVVAQEGVWTSNNPEIVEVSNADGRRGRITGISPGRATITARFGRQQAQAQIFVLDAELTELVVAPQMVETAPGLTTQLFAIGTFSDERVNDNLTGEVVWTSSDETVATVTNIPQFPGRVTGVSPGVATITATSNGVSASATVRVANRTVTDILISPPDPTLPVDAFQALSAIAEFDDGATGDVTANVTWSSSDSSVVAILPQPGLINTLVPGSAQVIATLGDIETTTTVTVRPAEPVSLVISPVNPIIRRMGPGGNQTRFYATGIYEDQSTSDLTQLCEWTSTDPSTLLLFDELGAKGLAFAIQAGSVQVTARCGELQATTTVTIR